MNFCKLLFAIILLFILATEFVFAQAGSVDNSFTPPLDSGVVSTIQFSRIESMILLPDGKQLIAGASPNSGTGGLNKVFRLNTNGSIDTTFRCPPISGDIWPMVRQNDGKIVIGGNFTSINNSPVNRLARLNQDGTIDPTFDIGSGPVGTSANIIFSLAISPLGKILVGGTFSSWNGVSKSGIVRLNPNGSNDVSFVGSGTSGAYNWVMSLVANPDESCFIGGYFTSYNGSSLNYFAKIQANGSLDNTYSRPFLSDIIESMALQSDGKLLLGGGALVGLFRLNTNGTRDATFGSVAVDNSIRYISIDLRNRILISGKFSNVGNSTRSRIARLSSNGIIDNLNTSSSVTGDCEVIISDSQNNVYVGGTTDLYSANSVNRIFRLLTNGNLDLNYRAGTMPASAYNGTARKIIDVGNNKLLVVGNFNFYRGNGYNHLAMLESDGRLNTTFNTGSGTDNLVKDAFLHNSNSILIGGKFTNYNGSSRVGICMINLAGQIQSAFTSPLASGGYINCIARLPNGNYIIGGNFSLVGHLGRNIAIVTASGRVTTDALNECFFNNEVNTIDVISQNKILIGGAFTTYNSISANYIICVNSSGINQNFISNTLDNFVLNISHTPVAKKVIIAGSFTMFNNNPCNKLLIIDSIGSALFVPNIGFNNSVQTLSIIDENLFVVGGQFSTYQNYLVNKIARISISGILDSSFNPRLGPNQVVYNTNIINSSLFATGDFVTYDGIIRNRIVKINNCIKPKVNRINAYRLQIGDTLKLYGDNFQNVLTASLNNGNVPIIRRSNSELIFLILPSYTSGFLSVRGQCGEDSIRVKICNNRTSIIISADSVRCGDSTQIIEAPSGFINYQWNTGETARVITGNINSSYSVQATTLDTCFSVLSNTIRLYQKRANQASILGDSIRYICQGTATRLETRFIASNYLWSNNLSSDIISVSDTGSYFLQTINNGCTSLISKPVIVKFLPRFKAEIDGDSIRYLCKGASTTIQAKFNSTYYLWNNNDTGKIISVRDTGSYFLQTINNGCTSLISDPIKVKFLTSPKAIIAGDSIVNLCGQDSIALTSQDLADNYIWNDSVYSKQRWVYETGFYSLRTILNGCTSSISKPVYVNIIPKPEILFDGDTIIESGGFTVINLLNKRYKYNWYPGLGLNDSLSPNPIIRPLVTTTYLVTAKSSDSCTNFKRITIKVVNSYSIPNIITPNGDGVNDVWILPVNEFSNVEFEIYNRWGMKVHSENMYHNSWNGSNLPEGLYYFSLTMTKELEQKKIKGWLQIINSTN